MTFATVLVSKPVNRPMPWSVCTTTSPGRSSVNAWNARPRVPSGRSARRRRSSRWSGITASFSCGAMKPSRRRACANQSALAERARLTVDEARPQPREVVGGALGLAAAVPRDDRHVAGAHELLELGLGLGDRARRGVRGLRAELVRLVRGHRREATRDARPASCAVDLLRREVEVMRVLECRLVVTSCQWSASAGASSSSAATTTVASLRHELEERAEALDRQHLGDVGALVAAPRPPPSPRARGTRARAPPPARSRRAPRRRASAA